MTRSIWCPRCGRVLTAIGRREMGERGHTKVVERFDIPRIAEQIQRVYGDLVT